MDFLFEGAFCLVKLPESFKGTPMFVAVTRLCYLAQQRLKRIQGGQDLSTKIHQAFEALNLKSPFVKSKFHLRCFKKRALRWIAMSSNVSHLKVISEANQKRCNSFHRLFSVQQLEGQRHAADLLQNMVMGRMERTAVGILRKREK